MTNVRTLFLCAAALLLSLVFAGCPKPAETVKSEEPPPPPPAAEKKPAGPDVTFTVAFINLAAHAGRIEQRDVDNLCKAVQREKADVLAVQGMMRYPGVATRLDVFDAIAAGTGMRSVFGETINVSGRQGGNALYSTYPIHSHEVKPYRGISSANFESMLVGLIDAGAREIAVVSTLLPEKASAADQNACQSALAGLRQAYEATPIIVTGNLPKPSDGAYRAEAPSGASALRAWYTQDGLRALESRSVDSDLGRLQVTQFGVYRKGRP